MRLAAIQKITMLDFPGHLSCTLFTQGCNYDCFYCHNRNLICSRGDTQVTDEELMLFLTKRVGMLEGVVISGGEPTIHDGLVNLISQIRMLGYAVKLDTNGSIPSMIHRLITNNLIDYVALDVKAPWSRYKEICGKGANSSEVEKTLHILKASHLPIEVRTTVCPDLLEGDLLRIAQQIGHVPLWRWNKYRIPQDYAKKDSKRIHTLTPGAEDLSRWAKNLHTVHENIVIEG